MERETNKVYEQASVQRKQAEFMARIANIELTVDEIRDYEYARSSDDDLFRPMSDQEILYICVSPEHKEKMARVYLSLGV